MYRVISKGLRMLFAIKSMGVPFFDSQGYLISSLAVIACSAFSKKWDEVIVNDGKEKLKI